MLNTGHKDGHEAYEKFYRWIIYYPIEFPDLLRVLIRIR